MGSTVADLTTNCVEREAIPAEDRAVLRRLAAELAELAHRPVEQEKRRLWLDHNALKPTRPLILCDPENSWNEILHQSALECNSPLASGWEWELRRQLFWGQQIRDDHVFEPFFDVGHVFSESSWGLSHREIRNGDHGGSYTWEPALKSYDDFDQLKFPQFEIDYDRTQRNLEIASDIFDDLLTVRLKTYWYWTDGMTWTLALMRGMEQICYDMVDHPDELHRLMSFLRDATLAKQHFLEDNNLWSLNNGANGVGSGGLGLTTELPSPGFDGKVRRRDMWGFGESQETVGVSPDMFAEFVLPYQLAVLDGFGLVNYGCCEPLDKRWKYVKTIPNLRRVSVSPWSNREVMAENLQDKYVFSMKPNPADLAMDHFEPDRIREILRRDLETTRGCNVEVVMKDCHTIRNDPQRVVEWTRIALEEAQAL